MPLLKDLTCSIELSDSQQALQEFGTTYGDGIVETHVSVPRRPQAFSVHLTSTKFIAPGLSIFVFVDGVYQCNRNRQGLELGDKSGKRSLVDFRVRQKEERQKDGSMIASPWMSDKLDTVSADKESNPRSQDGLERTGCINVVVLRCAGSRASRYSTHMSLDGAGDDLNSQYGLGGQPREPHGPPPPVSLHNVSYTEPFRQNFDTRSYRRHPPPEAYVNPPHHSHSRYSGSISPHERRYCNIPNLGFEYGSGPVPVIGAPFNQHLHHDRMPNTVAVDPLWLNDMLQKAAKQGIEESKRIDSSPAGNTEQKQQFTDNYLAAPPPGAWPRSPFSTTAQPASMQEDHFNDQDSERASQSKKLSTKSHRAARRDSRVTFEQEISKDSKANTDGWSSPQGNSSNAWDSDETWGTGKPSKIRERNQKSRSRASSTYKSSQPRSSTSPHAHTRHRSSDGKSRKTDTTTRSRKSALEEEIISSSEDDDEGWTHIEVTSSDSVASEDTVRNAKKKHKERFKWPSQASGVTSNKYGGDFSSYKQPHVPSYQPGPVYVDPNPSVIPGIVPKVMNSPFPTNPFYDPNQNLRRVSVYTNPIVPAVPPPGWGYPVPGDPNYVNQVPIPMLRTPYASNADEFAQSKVNDNDSDSPSSSKSTWGDNNKKDDGWKENNEAGWTEDNANEWKTVKLRDIRKRDDEIKWNDEKENRKTILQRDINDSYTISSLPKDSTVRNASMSKRHTTTSLSKYRRPSQKSADPVSTPLWQFPPPKSEKKPVSPSSNSSDSSTTTIVVPKETKHKSNKETTSHKEYQHEVIAGKGVRYGHAIGRPEYLDSLDKPYAVFRFNYCSRTALKNLFGDQIPSHGHLTVPTAQSALAQKREALKDLPHDELVAKMLKLQTKLAGHKHAKQKDSPEHKRKQSERRNSESSQRTDKVARNLTEKWVEDQSRESSVRTSSKTTSTKTESGSKKKKKKGEKEVGWKSADAGGAKHPAVTW